MGKRRGKVDGARGTKRKDILGTITPNEAFAILKSLAKEDKNKGGSGTGRIVRNSIDQMVLDS